MKKKPPAKCFTSDPSTRSINDCDSINILDAMHMDQCHNHIHALVDAGLGSVVTTLVTMHRVKKKTSCWSVVDALCVNEPLKARLRRPYGRLMPGRNSDNCCIHHKNKPFQVRAVVDLNDVRTSKRFVTLLYVWIQKRHSSGIFFT